MCANVCAQLHLAPVIHVGVWHQLKPNGAFGEIWRVSGCCNSSVSSKGPIQLKTAWKMGHGNGSWGVMSEGHTVPNQLYTLIHSANTRYYNSKQGPINIQQGMSLPNCSI